MLGGKLWVQSQLGQGSTFYFTLPFIPDIAINKNIAVIKSSEKEFQPGRKLKILVAEDDEVSAQLLTKMANHYGKEVLTAGTGVQAIETARLHPDLDLILMDIKMPEMNGYEAAKKIRIFNRTAIIIAQTAFALPDDHQKALEAGCDDYMTKPISQAVLEAKIEKYFGE